MITYLLLTPLLLAADPDPKAELIKFQGNWFLASGVVDGKPVPPDQALKGKITYDGDKATLLTPHQSADPITAKITAKPSANGGTMEFIRDKGPAAGVVIKAKYEWDGADSYKIVFDPSGKEQPKALESKAGSGHILHVWKRQKTKE